MKAHKNIRYKLIKQLFMAGSISWNESIEALISMCRMTASQALECMAQDFDRRQPIDVRRVA